MISPLRCEAWKARNTVLAQSFGPKGRQYAVRRAGHGIFEDALGWGEVAADKIVDSVAMRGHDHARPVLTGERRHIRSKLRQDLGALEQSHVIEGVDENLNWRDAQRFGELRGVETSPDGRAGKSMT
jgi:hypothetical protein